MSTSADHTPSVAQGPRETNEERMNRAPNVLEGYARDIDRYGRPIDSGLPSLLRFVAEQLRKQQAARAALLSARGEA